MYLLIEVVLVSCASNDDECAFADASEALIEDVNAWNVSYESYNTIELVSSGDTIPKEDHVIWLEVDPEYVSQSSGWPGRLMACSSRPTLSTSIKTIQVYTAANFNDSLSMGIELTERFEFYTPDDEPVPVTEIDILNEQFKSDFYLFLKPAIVPTETRVQYSIDIETVDGREFNLRTDPVYLK